MASFALTTTFVVAAVVSSYRLSDRPPCVRRDDRGRPFAVVSPIRTEAGISLSFVSIRPRRGDGDWTVAESTVTPTVYRRSPITSVTDVGRLIVGRARADG